MREPERGGSESLTKCGRKQGVGPAGRSRVSRQHMALCVLTVTIVAGAEARVQAGCPAQH